MLHWLLFAQVTLAGPAYGSPALERIIEEASRRNRYPPAGLSSYRASVESELAILARRSEGPEGAIAIEQVSNEVRWRVSGEFDQHISGYRAQSLGFMPSLLSFFREPWAVPILYGNRIALMLGRDSTRVGARRARRPVTAVHPLAEDRDRVYRYTGGDTAVIMRVGARDLPIIRVAVEPREDAPARTLAFRGELDIDVTRFVLVRMRGHFVTIAPARSLADRAFAVGGLEAVAYVELENGEFEGRYWLPTRQRFEAQASWSAASDSRSVFRIVSRYHDHRINDTSATAEADTLVPRRFRLSYAPADSLARFSGWTRELGDATSQVHSSDFDDVAPDDWRPDGPARTRFRVTRFADAFHVNRVEGAWTGWGMERRFRDDAPGLVVRGTAGWAWSEQTVRGRASVERARGRWGWVVRAGRSLDLTNEFRSVFDSGSALAAVATIDNYDYVDRRLLAAGVEWRLDRARSVVRLELGPARDGAVRRNLDEGLFASDSGFRDNRGVRPGRYWRQLAAFEWRPDVSAEFLRTGMGGLVTAEHASGALDYTRVDARFVARQNRGPLTVALRLDVGAVVGDAPPPQQLFELGRNTSMQGYSYKEFAGNRAALGRALAMYRIGVLDAPVRLGRWFLPGLSPALSAGAQGGWTRLHGTGAARAAADLWQPLRSDTDGIRSSATLGVRLFAGAVGLGFARPLDHAGAWRFRVEFGQLL